MTCDRPMKRADVLATIADDLIATDPGHPLRVGVDGICGSGKSTFTRELAEVLRVRGAREVVLVDSDGFHHLREHRYRQGRDSARGYYEDGYDVDALSASVLEPLGPGGDRRFATKVHDLASDEVVTDAWANCTRDAIVLFEATFVQRGALREKWDVVIWLEVARAIARARGVGRDAAALGGVSAAEAAYDARYLAACRIYLDAESPSQKADVVVVNDDPADPELVRAFR
jgi:uridine kinase